MVGRAAMPRSRKPSEPARLRGCDSYTIRHFPMRPVAQKQSARLISGRPWSVTAPDDHLTIRKPKSEIRKDSHENCQGTQIEEPTGRRHRPVEGTPRETKFAFHQAEV